MTPKEKAIELVDKFHNEEIDYFYNDSEQGQCIGSGNMTYESAVDCAIIAVDEMLDELLVFWCGGNDEKFEEDRYENFWQKVKIELEQLKK